MSQILKIASHTLIFVVLTLVTQIGGIAWLLSLWFRRSIVAFIAIYAAMTIATVWLAPITGRIALSCSGDGPLQASSWASCVTNRNYVKPELAEVLKDAAQAVDKKYPGAKTIFLDANFPFLNWFPLLPHLSHKDGKKADIAFYYRNEKGYLPGKTRSPIGYFAFENGPTDCPQNWLTLRWDFALIQWLWPVYELEPDRVRFMLTVLADDPRVGKIFIEPHLKNSLGLRDPKIRFQGCRAARHDDHIHIQLN